MHWTCSLWSWFVSCSSDQRHACLTTSYRPTHTHVDVSYHEISLISRQTLYNHHSRFILDLFHATCIIVVVVGVSHTRSRSDQLHFLTGVEFSKQKSCLATSQHSIFKFLVFVLNCNVLVYYRRFHSCWRKVASKLWAMVVVLVTNSYDQKDKNDVINAVKSWRNNVIFVIV